MPGGGLPEARIDTAGPAINPLIKVMNLVSLLIAPAVVAWSVGDDKNTPLRIVVALVAALVIVAAVVFRKRKAVAMADSGSDDSGVGSSEEQAEPVSA